MILRSSSYSEAKMRRYLNIETAGNESSEKDRKQFHELEDWDLQNHPL